MKSEDVASLYDEQIKKKYKKEYEHARWFSDKAKEAEYAMTKTTILRHLKNIPSCRSYLEVGPGPGTWTKLFFNKDKETTYTLVDVSKEMLALAQKNMPQDASVSLVHSGFLEAQFSTLYDFIFSSRAIEYIEDKSRLVKKLSSLLKKNGHGVIITKNPDPVRLFFRRKKLSKLHQNQIRSTSLKKLLKKEELIVRRITPATVHVPLIGFPALNKFVFALVGRLPLNPLTSVVTESYCVSFKKP
ncbi:hypothetical protein CL654_02770 [bacterium]|nr:hypothetical protein [bacterium]|tara:strand:+ start:4595 stop:5326 length:732 start_codon:yes stop_codon:yes gene_type:complete